ncbi:MAG: hypothetical protein E7656_06595 [Ruminococcaceae bacterium]|nr:hypothetical protein [Oscillospiraceae bacterium]
MEVTDVKFRKVFETEPLKAVCSITLNDAIAVHDIKLVRAKSKTIVVMPARRRADGEFVDIIHPINSGSRQVIEQAVINEYHRVCENNVLSQEI